MNISESTFKLNNVSKVTHNNYKALYIRAAATDIYCALVESNPNNPSHIYIKESVDRAEQLWDELTKRKYT